jgi:phosphoglycolate phosphatase-like HAD superfamily hydrolase
MKFHLSVRPVLFAALLAATPLPGLHAQSGAVGDPLPSWNDGEARTAVITFVTKVTTSGLPTFVPPAGRIATFDHDGTLWAEQPIYFQFQFAIDRVKALAPDHPEWKNQEPFKHVLAGDLAGLLAGGEKAILPVLVTAHAGFTTEEFRAAVRDWLATARHPKTGLPYNKMVYQPMLELLAYLRANSFKTFIVSEGGVEFMRAFAEEAYGIPPEQVVGSHGKLKYEMRDGKPVLVKLPEMQFAEDREGKPATIQTFVGHRPLAAFGNSDGDLQMLEWTQTAPGPRFALLVHHTDADREWAYDRKSPVGKLDAAWDLAKAKGWTVVDMKADWKTIFPAPAAPVPAVAAPVAPAVSVAPTAKSK